MSQQLPTKHGTSVSKTFRASSKDFGALSFTFNAKSRSLNALVKWSQAISSRASAVSRGYARAIKLRISWWSSDRLSWDRRLRIWSSAEFFSACRSPLYMYLLLRIDTNFDRDPVILRSVSHSTWAALPVKAPYRKASLSRRVHIL